MPGSTLDDVAMQLHAGTPLSLWTKLWFGVGQAAEGIKTAAFSAFLLLFYSQVLGLEPWLAGVALFVAMAFDAVTDPLIGSLSDSWHGRWGRRHPFMYVAAVPLGAMFYCTFAPPAGLSQYELFAWMLTFAVLTRAAMTLYHVPHMALGAELSTDYTERSVIVAYRNFFGFAGAGALFAVVRTTLMKPTATYPNGQLNPDAYPLLGLYFGAAMCGLIWLSALGTHSRIAHLPRPHAARRFSLSQVVGELRQALGDGTFRALFAAMLFYYMSRGFASALGMYLGTYFWQLGSDALSVPLYGFAGVLSGTVLWARLASTLEKRTMFVMGYAGLCAAGVGPVLAQWLGLFPPAEAVAYKLLIYAFAAVAALFTAAAAVSSGSMLADVVDAHEAASGKRQEGIFFGAMSLSSKASVGLGNSAGAAVLSLIAFPTHARPGEVSQQVIDRLALSYAPGQLVLLGLALWAMRHYPLNRARHREIRRSLQQPGGVQDSLKC